jgi:hypothetical protein
MVGVCMHVAWALLFARYEAIHLLVALKASEFFITLAYCLILVWLSG